MDELLGNKDLWIGISAFRMPYILEMDLASNIISCANQELDEAEYLSLSDILSVQKMAMKPNPIWIVYCSNFGAKAKILAAHSV